MTDAHLAIFLGIETDPQCAEIIARITPERRASYERMAGVSFELELWQRGLGPMPKSVVAVCRAVGTAFTNVEQHDAKE